MNGESRGVLGPVRSRGWALFTVLALCGAACAPAPPERLDVDTSAAQMAEPLPKPDVTLTDQAGQPYDLAARTEDRLALIFFGFTHCPDVCPITMGNVAGALDLLDPTERDAVDAIFISVDPARDTPERLTEWLANLDPSIVGLTGPSTDISAVLTGMGYAALPPQMDSMDHTEHYDVSHPSSLFVYTPDGRGRFVYLYGSTSPSVVAEDLRTLLAMEW